MNPAELLCLHPAGAAKDEAHLWGPTVEGLVLASSRRGSDAERGRRNTLNWSKPRVLIREGKKPTTLY